MNTWISHRGALGGFAAAVIVTALGLSLASSAQAAPTLTLTATDAVVGQSIHATAQLSESPNAVGEISFEIFGPGEDCSGSPLTPAPAAASVSGEGPYASGDFTPSAAGTYHWSAHYSGDTENLPAESTCSAISVVDKASPGLTGNASAVVVGGTIHDQATLSGGFSPGGEVTFSVFGPADSGCSAPLSTVTAPIVGSSATSADFTPSSAGGFRWTAHFPGDANNKPVSTPCGDSNQTSLVSKASPLLSGAATSALLVGLPITDNVTLSGSFGATGQLVFRAYGPDDETCATAPAFVKAIDTSGDAPYAPGGYIPLLAGVYRWTVEYAGDANNEATSTACGAAGQSSAVGMIGVTLTANASGGTVGEAVTASAAIVGGATPTGQLVFNAFPPGDTTCSGTPAFTSTASVANDSASSAPFVATRVGTYRWTVAYSGDANHKATTTGCGEAASSLAKAKPTIVGKVPQRLTVGTSFQDTATLQGAYAAGGTITFRIYGPVASGCAKPLFVNTVAVTGNGTVSSDPFVALRPGRYSFVASYSGDAENQAVSEPCDSAGQVAKVLKREPKVKPRARLIGSRLISIGARLSGGVSPSGLVNFRLYGPDDRRCKRKPAFSGGITVSSNGSFSLAKYLATRPGVYRLEVGYSGDPRNERYRGGCGGAQTIRVG